MTQDLTALRNQIDQIDDGILALLDQRMDLAKHVAEAKKETGKSILDTEREAQLLERLKSKVHDKNYSDEKILEIWGKIIELSRDVQRS